MNNLHDRPLIEQMAVTYTTEIERLNAEIDSSREQHALLERRYNVLSAVVKHHENEIERLRAALEEIAKLDAHINPGVYIARAALAKEERE